MKAFHYKGTVLLESINQFHRIKLYSLKNLPNMLALCWHSTLVYYTFYSTGIFDTGLSCMLIPSTRDVQMPICNLIRSLQPL